MKRRLEPAFDFVDSKSDSEHKALVVIPGIGCGLFGGKFVKQLPLGVFVPFDGEMSTTAIGNITSRIRPHLKQKTPMLSDTRAFAEGTENFSKDRLFKFVAWDHRSCPGNNFLRCKHQTDDGVSAAATDCMARVLGVTGCYDGRGRYMPSNEYETWEHVVKANDILLRVQRNLQVTSESGANH